MAHRLRPRQLGCAQAHGIRYNQRSLTLNRGRKVKGASLETKKAHCAKTRRSNYAASLRLEGYDVTPEAAGRTLPSREDLLQKYSRQA